MEYFVNRTWALGAGIFTDRATTPEVQSGKADQLEHVDLYGLSASITHHTDISALTLGTSYSQGNGDAQIVGGSTSIQEVDSTGCTVFVSAAYRY